MNQDDVKNAFKYSVATDSEINTICKDMIPVKSEEEEANILLLSHLTQLKEIWCGR